MNKKNKQNNMKKTLLLIAITLFSLSAFSQKVDSLFFDKKERITNFKKKAKYKELTTTYEDGITESIYYKIKGDVLISSTKFKNNHPIGVWVTNNEKGDLILERDFDKVVYAKPYVADKNKKDTLEGRDIVSPSYGEEGDRLNYMAKSLRYPKEAKESEVQGTVYITYTITKEGDIVNIEILRGVNPYLDYEAYRVVSEMGKWKPGTLDGEPIETKFNMPIRFILAN